MAISVNAMRTIDHWAGVPLCALASPIVALFDLIAKPFRKPGLGARSQTQSGSTPNHAPTHVTNTAFSRFGPTQFLNRVVLQ